MIRSVGLLSPRSGPSDTTRSWGAPDAGRRKALATMGAAMFAAGLPATVCAQQKPTEPERLRGQISGVEPKAITLRTRDGRAIRIGLGEFTTIFRLQKATFAEVDFGLYVGAASERMDGDIYSPIRRDSLSWLHRGFELRLLDEKLRGMAVGVQKWDLSAKSIMTHGWVDDMEERVISIKYGPTEEEETDVEIGRDVPVHRMTLGDRTLVRDGARVFLGAMKAPDGTYEAAFMFFGQDGVVPSL